LRDAVLADVNRDALTDPQAAKPADVAGLRKRLVELDRDIDRAADRLLTAPDDLRNDAGTSVGGSSSRW
jgi:hypothetical protein